jgi:phage-related protein
MDGDDCETELLLNDLAENYQASAIGLFRLIEQIVESGLDCLSTKQCHLVDRDNKIYELIKGDIRLLFFKGHGDTLIVTTHVFLKKTQKTPEKHKNKAIRYKKEYQKAHDRNQIDFVKDQEE